MSEAKFTKGEWVVKGTSMSMGNNYRGNFYVESNGFSGDISDANIANKSLIKASPKMYAMLEMAMNILNGDDFDNEVSSSDIEDLLAEARGEHAD